MSENAKQAAAAEPEKPAAAPEQPAPEVEMAAESQPEAAAEPEKPKRDPTAHKPKEPTYSVYNADGKRLVGGVSRPDAVRKFDETKRSDGRAPRLLADS